MKESPLSLPTITLPVRPALFPDKRPALIVASHQRSGTHFTMNALANCYGYVSNPWINLDNDTANLNYFYYGGTRDYLLALSTHPVATIVKSHHPAGFFPQALLDRIAERWVIVVPIRDPVSTLISYWKFLKGVSWFEGPTTDTPEEFFKAEPCGHMMRYQTRQYPNLMFRWADHVESWADAAKSSRHVVIVRYEELVKDFETVMRGFAPVLGREPIKLVKPDREKSKWLKSEWGGAEKPVDVDGLRKLCRETIGKTMDRFGY